jgi:hypothetical protein
MHREERAQAAMPHLPRIRMNALGEAPAKSGIVELARAPRLRVGVRRLGAHDEIA